MSERVAFRSAAYVLPFRDGKVLLMRRANTPYCEGYYGVPSGHLEKGETPVQAATRELLEETGLRMSEEDLGLRYITFRQANHDYHDYYFVTDVAAEVEPRLVEPESCDDMQWFDVSDLPENVVPEVTYVLKNMGEALKFACLDLR